MELGSIFSYGAHPKLVECLIDRISLDLLPNQE